MAASPIVTPATMVALLPIEARRLTRVDRFRSHSHAAADVKKHRELDRPIGLCAEVENRPDLPGFGYDEILPLEVSNEASFSIANDGAHRHDVDRRSKCGNRRLLSRDSADDPGSGEQGQRQRRVHYEETPRHISRYSKEFAKRLSY